MAVAGHASRPIACRWSLCLGLPGSSVAAPGAWDTPFPGPLPCWSGPGRTGPTAYAAAGTSLASHTRLYPATANSVHIRLRTGPQ